MSQEIPEVHREAASILEELTGGDVRPYINTDFGRQKQSNGVSVVVSQERAESVVRELQERLPDSHVGYIGTTRWLGDEDHDGVELAAGVGEEQFDILFLARTDAVNYGMMPEDIVEKLRGWDERFGIRITQAETDTTQFDLVGFPDDIEAFAGELEDFCPDIIYQGVGTIERLVDMLEVTGRVTLWWD